jgi:general secretion pathway protein L
MLLRFLRWWGGELGAMVPRRGEQSVDGAGQWLTVERDAGGLVRARMGGARGGAALVEADAEPAEALAGELGAVAASLDPRRVRCRFRVPPSEVLVKDLTLPLAAQENLQEVLAFEMSRHTPFHARDVHFEYRVLATDAARQRLDVRLAVVPRSRLAPLLAPFAGWRLQPEHDAGGVVPLQGEVAAFAFRPAEWRRRSAALLNSLLAATVLALAGFAAWQPLDQQQRLRERLEGEVAAAREAAAEVATLRDRLDAERESRGLIATARGERPPMTVLLEMVSRVLPDGTYLHRFEVRGRQIDLHGSSTAASTLIGILEDTPGIREVRFASPVTRDGATGRERFHIVGELVPGEAGA